MSVLSQEEIDALINNLSTDDPADVADTKRIKDFDFRFSKRLEKFNNNQLQSVRAIHDNFTRLLNNTMSVYLRTKVELTVSRIEQIAYGDFLAAYDRDSLLALFSMDPMPGSGMFRMELNLGLAIIDRLLGGPGGSPEKMRDLTEIERTLIQRFLVRFFNSYREAWSYLQTISFKIEALDSNPQFIPRILQSDQLVAMVACELKVGQGGGSVNFCLPYSVLSSVGAQLTEFQWASNVNARKALTNDDANLLTNHVGRANADVQVELGVTSIPLNELMHLEPGHVIIFDAATDKPLTAYINGCKKFHVYPGVHRDRLAVQVADVIEEEN